MTIRRGLCILSVVAAGMCHIRTAEAQPTGWLLRATRSVQEQIGTDRPRLFRRSIELQDASLATLKKRLGWFGIDIPLELEGDVTASLGVEVDLSNLGDARAYRINGSLSSKRLIVEGFTLQRVSAALRYVDGTLTLQQLVASIPDSNAGEPTGRIEGEAAVQIIPIGEVTATLRLNGVPLEPFRQRIEALAALEGGRLSGRLSAEAPVATVRDVTTWRGNGQLTMRSLLAAGREVDRVEAAFHAVDGRMTLSNATATVEEERVSGRGWLALSPPFAFEARVDVSAGRFERLEGLLKRPLPGRWQGAYSAAVDAAGALKPFRMNATAKARGDDAMIADLPVNHFSTDLKTDGATLELVELAAHAADGQWTGQANVVLKAPYRYASSLSMQGVDLEETVPFARLLDPGIRLAGIASGRFTSSGSVSPRDVSATGQLDIRELQLNDQHFSSATLEGSLSKDVIELSSLEMVAEDSRIQGKGRIELSQKRNFTLQMRPQRFDLAALEPLMMMASADEAPTQRTVAYRGQQEADDASGQRPPSPVPAIKPSMGGTVTGDMDVAGQWLPFQLDALDGSLAFDDLEIAGVTFDRAEIVAATVNRTINLSRLLLVKGEGRVEGNGSLGLDPPGEFRLRLQPADFAIDAATPLFGTEGIAAMHLPAVSGALNGDMTVAGEMQPFRLASAEGTLSGDRLRIGRLLANHFEIAVATKDDHIDISKFSVLIDDGRLTGRGSIGLAGQQPFELTLRPDSFRVELLKPLFGEGGLVESDFPPVAGRVSGEMTLKGRLAPAMLEGVSGRLQSENGRVSGVPFQRATVTVSSDAGIATVSNLNMASTFGTLNGAGSIELSAPYRYSADLTFNDFDLSAIGDLTASITEEQRPDIDSPAEVARGPGVLPVELEGLATISGRIGGTIAPFVLTGEGDGKADRLVLDANDLNRLFKRTTLAEPRFGWRYNENRLTMRDFIAGLGGGTLSGTAAVPLGAHAGGAIDLEVVNVFLADVLELPAKIDGIADGRVAATLGPVDESGVRSASGDADLSLQHLRLGRASAGDVTSRFTFREGVVGYDVDGTLFDGPLHAKGTLSLDAADRDESAGQFRWTGGNLARLAFGFSDDPSFAGRVDAQIDYDLSAAVKATGAIEVSEVRRGNSLLTDRFAARLLWTDSELRIENAAGGYAGGTLAVTADLNPLDYTRGTVGVLLRRADAQRAVGWIPGLEPLEGTLDMRLRGRLGDLWRWQGDAEVGRGSYGPLTFSSARVPLTIDANPFRGALHVETHRASLRAAHGRAVLNVSADLGFSQRIDVDVAFNNFDAAAVLDGGGLASRLSGGRLNGTLHLASRNFRSVADLDGSLVATLSGSRAQDLPVIGSVFDVARLPTGGGGRIERGDIRVFIRSGVARIEELALAGPSFRLFAAGTIALSSERLALDVVADTSPSQGDRLIAAFLLRQFVDYGTPIGWIDQANRFISNRAIYLRVTGTIDRPTVRIRPFEQLGQEAVRFFLNEIALPAGGGVGDQPF